MGFLLINQRFKQGFLVLCQQDKQFNYFLYQTDTIQLKIVQLKIQGTPDSQNQNSEILSVNSVNNVITLVQSLGQVYDQVRVTQLTVNKNQNLITQVYNDIPIPISTNNILNTFISANNGLITIVTNNIIVGICISESNVVFQIQNESIPDYFAFTSNLYGEQIAIQYSQISKTPNYITKFITTNIPKLIFTQVSQQEQIYSLSFRSDAQIFQKSITANLITGDSNAIIIKNNKATFVTVQTSPQEIIKMDIEKYFTGYITSGDVSDTFNNAQLQSLEKRFVQNGQQPKRVFSTFTSNYLVESFDSQQNAYTLTIQSASFSEQLSHDLGKITFQAPLMHIDEQSGYFLNTNAQGQLIINVFFQQHFEDKVYQFGIINTRCDGNSKLLYSGDTVNNQVVVLCDKSLSVYKFSKNTAFIINQYTLNYPADQIYGTITKIEIQPSGLLYITDNYRIMAIDINLNFYVGQVLIPANPEGQFTGQVIFFTESFILARNDNNSPIIQQFSYNKFNGAQATMIRTLLNFGFNNWIGNGLQSIKNFSQNSDQEFLIVDTKIDDQNIKKLFYRVSITRDIQAQNQLFTTFNLNKSTPFFVSPSMVGYFFNKQYVFYELYYRLTLLAQIKIDPSTFVTQIANNVNGKLNINGKYEINLSLFYYRNVSTSFTKIINDGAIKNFFDNSTVQLPYSYAFDDRQLSNSHLFGWAQSPQVNQQEYKIDITQRITKEFNQINKNLKESLNQIMVMPNALMISTTKGIFIEQLSLSSTYQPNCKFFIDDGKQDVSKTNDGKTVIKQSIYSISLDYSQSDTITFTNYQIQGTYDTYPTSQPAISLIQKDSYTQNSKLLLNQSIVTIISDINLGLLVLLQEKGNSSSQVCKMDLTKNTNQNSFSLDCSIYKSISNQQISNIIYIKSANQNVFVTKNKKIYYGITQDLSKCSVIDLENLFTQKGIQIYQNQMINYSQKLSESSILISQIQGNSFVLTIEFKNNQISINDIIQTLYLQPGFQFVGSFYQNYQNQIFQLFKSLKDPTIYFLVMYERYNQSQTDYLIRSSYKFTYANELTQSMISWYNGQLILGLSSSKNDNIIPSTFSIQDKPQMDIKNIQSEQKVSIQTKVDLSIGMMPLYQTDQQLILKTKVLLLPPNKSSDSLTYSRRMNASMILIFLLLCLI